MLPGWPGGFFLDRTGLGDAFQDTQNSVLFIFCGKISAILEITDEKP